MGILSTDQATWPFDPNDICSLDGLLHSRRIVVTDGATIAANAGVLPRGTVLGKQDATGQYLAATATATDGSQHPAAILVTTAPNKTAPQIAPIYLRGEFNTDAVIFDQSFGTVDALLPPLQSRGIYLKSESGSPD